MLFYGIIVLIALLLFVIMCKSNGPTIFSIIGGLVFALTYLSVSGVQGVMYVFPIWTYIKLMMALTLYT